MIVFTVTAQRYDADGKADGVAYSQTYIANGLAIDTMGASAPREKQIDDENAVRSGVGRKARDVYRDLAHAMGVRRLGWREKVA